LFLTIDYEEICSTDFRRIRCKWWYMGHWRNLQIFVVIRITYVR